MSFFHDIESDGITGLHGIHALISWAIMRYGYRGLNYRDDDIFSIYRAALLITKMADITTCLDTLNSMLYPSLDL